VGGGLSLCNLYCIIYRSCEFVRRSGYIYRPRLKVVWMIMRDSSISRVSQPTRTFIQLLICIHKHHQHHASIQIKFKHCALSSIPSFITHPYRTVQYTTVRAGFTNPPLSSPASIIIDEAFQWYNLASPPLSNPIPSRLFPTKTLSPLSRVSQCQHTHCRHPLALSSAAPCRYIAQPPSTHRTGRRK
jgi:hypothetical protein